jgi:hypothetical protein
MTKTTSRLIALVESGDNKYAVRYEPTWRYVTVGLRERFVRAHREMMVSKATSQMMLSTSWGKFQMMGSVLYELGYNGKLLDFATSETLQEIWFDKFLTNRDINFTFDELMTDGRKRYRFAHRYNGDTTGVYESRMIEIAKGM